MRFFKLGAGLFAATLAWQASAQSYVYPAQGQSQEQTERDKYECNEWAKRQTGFDPSGPQYATRPPPRSQQQEGQIVRGTARGAILGGIIDGSDGAKKGAAAGALLGGLRKSDQRRRQEDERRRWEDEQTANYNYNRRNYDRAFAACIESRGYSIR